MPRRNVFICYSHDDQELFEAFATQLAPYKHQHELKVWTDQEIIAGAEWEPAIYAAIARADAAVVLVSPDLLASEFIRDQELPRLLEAWAEKRLHLAPLFLRHASPQRLRFEVETAEGTREVDLADFQGLNVLSQPVAGLDPNGRDKVLAAAAEKLYQILAELPAPDRRRHRPRRELEMKIELRDDGHRVSRSFGLPPDSRRRSLASAQPGSHSGACFRFRGPFVGGCVDRRGERRQGTSWIGGGTEYLERYER